MVSNVPSKCEEGIEKYLLHQTIFCERSYCLLKHKIQVSDIEEGESLEKVANIGLFTTCTGQTSTDFNTISDLRAFLKIASDIICSENYSEKFSL